MIFDVAIVGGGPAGLCAAIGLRLRGLTVLVCEKSDGAVDKACGEGVMPVGLEGLRALGVMQHLDASRAAAIVGIRYINENGRAASAALPAPGGQGIRRVALSAALQARAREVGVVIAIGSASWAKVTDGWTSEAHRARFLIAADGLHSPLRKQLGVTASQPSRRFGLRQHFKRAPWTDHVEVYFADGVEAYVTPVGRDEVGVAFLWDTRSRDGTRGFEAFLALFPALAARLAGAEPTSQPRGAGPLEQVVTPIVGPDWALVGDAAGYLDAITGEGISLAVATTAVLAAELSEKRAGVMVHYAREHRRAFSRYLWLTRSLLSIATRPRVRRRVVRLLAAWPALFRLLLRLALR